MDDRITRDELRQAIAAAEVTVIDALPARPYRKRHLPQAVNLVAEDPDSTVRAVLTDPHAAIAVYSTDDDCERGPELASRLQALGYTHVRLYAEGIEGWVEAGLPVDAGG